MKLLKKLYRKIFKKKKAPPTPLQKWVKDTYGDKRPEGFPFNLTSDNKVVSGGLFFADGKLLRVTEVEKEIVCEELDFDSMENFKFRTEVGLVRIEYEKNSELFELCRADMKFNLALAAAVKALNAKKEGKDGFRVDVKERKCPKCGRIYRDGSSKCAHCSMGKREILKRLFKIARPYMLPILLSVVLFFMTTAIQLITPQIQKAMVDDYINADNTQKVLGNVTWGLIILVLGLAVANLATRILGIFRNNLLAKVGNKIVVTLCNMTFEKVQAMSVADISKRTAGDLMNRISNDTSRISQFITRELPNIIEQVLTFTAVVIVLLFYNPLLTLLILIPAPFVAILFRLIHSYTHKLYHKQWFVDSEANTVLHDIFKGIRVVKVFGTEKRETEKYDKAAKDVAEISEKNEIIWNILTPISNFAFGIGSYIITYFVGVLILKGEMSFGDMTMISSYASFIYGPLRWASHLPRMIVRTFTSVTKVFEIVDEEPEVTDKSDALDIDIKGNIDFENVDFSYEETNEVLKNINLSIKPGEMIGIVGRSGAGKSTLINLVMRLYDVKSGAIRIDGHDIRDLSQHSLRSQIGAVLQETFLFSGTIYANIAYSNPAATREEIIRAAKLANAHSFIMKLPDGYNTYIGESGYTLSGGERQRLAIARAVLTDPKILILDEATASLDTETEKLIQDALQKLTKNRTTLAIAHRLSTLRNATRLIVIDNNTIAESGTHDELIEKRGIYYGLINAQRQMHKISKDDEDE
ncbi:MAG: ATP-binding cassette domain-containing protein [Ruminococcaceae bacterium]|nr:ATP-binding cassette domain-containing protein [Oscillospiraceae bacterium]